MPFEFAGVLKINPETEEVILEPRDRRGTAREGVQSVDRRLVLQEDI